MQVFRRYLVFVKPLVDFFQEVENIADGIGICALLSGPVNTDLVHSQTEILQQLASPSAERHHAVDWEFLLAFQNLFLVLCSLGLCLLDHLCMGLWELNKYCLK